MRNIIHIKLFLVNKKTWDYYSKSNNFRKDVFKKKNAIEDLYSCLYRPMQGYVHMCS